MPCLLDLLRRCRRAAAGTSSGTGRNRSGKAPRKAYRPNQTQRHVAPAAHSCRTIHRTPRSQKQRWIAWRVNFPTSWESCHCLCRIVSHRPLSSEEEQTTAMPYFFSYFDFSFVVHHIFHYLTTESGARQDTITAIHRFPSIQEGRINLSQI